MATVEFERVAPGDLITAEFMNRVLAQIERTQAQVDAITGGSPEAPIITGLIPAGDVPERSVLEILGRNFATPANVNTVTLDSTAVTGFLTGSNDTRLRVGVPAGISGLPKQMTLTVTTLKGSASTRVRIVPEELPIGGQPRVLATPTSLGTILAGNTYTFPFRLEGTALTGPETFLLKARFTSADPAGTEGTWEAATDLIGTTAGRITLTPASSVTVGVQTTIPSGAKAANLTLHATSLHNSPASDGQSLLVPIKVGAAAPVSDPRISIFIGAIGGAAPFRAADIDGTLGLEVQYAATGTAGRKVLIPIDTRFQVGGTYEFAVSIQSPGTVWDIEQPTPRSVPVNAGDAQDVKFNLILKATAAAGEKTTLTFTATRKETTGVGPISAFASFPIRGFA